MCRGCEVKEVQVVQLVREVQVVQEAGLPVMHLDLPPFTKQKVVQMSSYAVVWQECASFTPFGPFF